MKNFILGIIITAVMIGFISGAIFVPGLMLLEWLFPGNSIIYFGMAGLIGLTIWAGKKYIDEGGE